MWDKESKRRIEIKMKSKCSENNNNENNKMNNSKKVRFFKST